VAVWVSDTQIQDQESVVDDTSAPTESAALQVGKRFTLNKRFTVNKDYVARVAAGSVLLAMVVYCVVGAVSINFYSFKLFSNRLDNTMPEGPHVYAAIRSAETGQLYHSFREAPHIMQSYGPLFYLSTTAVARLSHLDVDLTIRNFRLLSYLSYLGIALIVFLICKKLSGSIPLSLLAALMMMAQHDFLGWNITVRPDLLMMLFMVLSLFFAVHMEDRPWTYCVLSGISSGFAFLFKQPGAGVAIAIVLLFLFWREYRKAIVFSGAAAFPVIVVILGLIWHKEQFLEQLTSVSKGYWSLAGGAEYLWKAASKLTYIIPWMIGLLGFARAVKMGKSWQLVASFALFSVLVALSGLPQAGATSNYYIPALVGCALLMPLAAQSLQGWRYLPAAALIITPALLFATQIGLRYNLGYFHYFKSPQGMSYAPLRPFRMISDVPLLSMKGHDPELLDDFALHSLELTGYWDAAPVIEELRQGQIDLVVLVHLTPHVEYTPRPEFSRIVIAWRGISELSPAIVSALNENYDVFCATPVSVAFKPKNRSLNLSPDFFSAYFGWKCGANPPGTPPRLVMKENSR